MTEAASAPRALRLGTRASRLARWQADWVAGQLRQRGHAVQIVDVHTGGDADQRRAIADIGAPGVFTKELQRAVLACQVDLAVHSLKDLPTDEVPGLVLAAVPPRQTPADVLVTPTAARLVDLPPGARVGTGSLRRQAQLRSARPDLAVSGIRGNVDTRLNKLDAGQFDALVLAEAGLVRLGAIDRIAEVLGWEIMLPAVGQGALGIECRSDDTFCREALATLDDRTARAAVVAERALLAHLRGGCLAPIGAVARIQQRELALTAVVLSPDGSRRLDQRRSAPATDAALLGRQVAETLLARGAAELIAASRLPDSDP